MARGAVSAVAEHRAHAIEATAAALGATLEATNTAPDFQRVLLRRGDEAHGAGWVVLALTSAWLADTAGYFAGRFLGKHKLYEAVSPKKTIEGFVGALLGASLGAVVAHFWYLPTLPLVSGVALALVRLSCGVSGATQAQAAELRQRYHVNTHPALGMFNVTNRYTFGAIFQREMGAGGDVVDDLGHPHAMPR